VSTVNSGHISDVHSLITVQMKEDAREFTVVDIGTILGLAYLIPEMDLCWIVNSLIIFITFNKVYEGIRILEGICNATLCQGLTEGET